MCKMKDYFFKILGKNSYKKMVTIFFVMVAVVPMIFLLIVSYRYLKKYFEENMEQLLYANVEKTRSNVESTLSAYEDILYQLYTNDEAIEYIQNIDSDEEQALNINRLRHYLHAMCYAREGIEAVSVFTPEGNMIHYDKLTASYVNSSWLENVEKTENEIYMLGMRDYNTHILPTHYAKKQLNEDNYLFHMLHRIIDYKDTSRACGVVVISINENVLEKICEDEKIENSESYIIDDVGKIISDSNKEKIGLMMSVPTQEKVSIGSYGKKMYYVSEPVEGWKIVLVYRYDVLWSEIARQIRNYLFIDIMIILAALGLMLLITKLLAQSMNDVVSAMNRAKEGDMTAVVEKQRVVSSEMVLIVDTFNQMMKRMVQLMTEIKENERRRKDAEIATMEAQINPHFLYNILDSINWIAIESEEFEISQMVTSLARILRYSINRSNSIVTFKEELEWIRQYVYLQSIRFKDNYEYITEIDSEELLEYKIHKLILQPFIENAIVHGFRDSGRKNLLSIHIYETAEYVRIDIRDNGMGIAPEILEQIKTRQVYDDDHIGMANAIGRINTYYGDKAVVKIESTLGNGTTVTLCIKNG